jgi:hypothetical protein
MDWMKLGGHHLQQQQQNHEENVPALIIDELYQLLVWNDNETMMGYVMKIVSFVLAKFGKAFYVMFFLVVHLMKLHSISLMWGVTSEAMEYEEQAEIRAKKRDRQLGGVGGSHAVTMMDMEGEKASVGDKSVNNGSSSKEGGGGKSRSVYPFAIIACLFLGFVV